MHQPTTNKRKSLNAYQMFTVTLFSLILGWFVGEFISDLLSGLLYMATVVFFFAGIIKAYIAWIRHVAST